MAKHSRKVDGRPSWQFYPSDWLEESGLRLCDLSARGLWIDLLCYMFKMEERGHLRINGSVLKCEHIAMLVGRPVGEVDAALKQLINYGVCETDDDGSIYNRRMVRIEDDRRRKSEAGKAGATARWSCESDANEMRKYGSSSSSSSPTSSSTSSTNSKREELLLSGQIQQIFDRWNSHKNYARADGLPRLRKTVWQSHRDLTPEKVKAIEAALSEGYTVEQICGAIDNYALVLLDDDFHKWTYTWSIYEFLNRRSGTTSRDPRKWYQFLPDNFEAKRYK